jgi:hypothetical protein
VEQMHASEWLLGAAVFFFSLNFGPMTFESFTSDRTWASNPPDSFSMFLGPYGQKTTNYWRIVAPLALISFVLSIVFNWHLADRRLWLSIAFGGYLIVHGATLVYFVPEQETLISSAGSLSREVLKARADRWIFRNYFRNVAAVVTFACLLRAILAPLIP